MSLNYDYEKVPHDVVFPKRTDPDEIAYFRQHQRTCGYTVIDNGDDDFRVFSDKTNALIWLTIPVGISRITPKNWEEFYRRAFIYRRVRGSSVELTAQDVRNHIGLSTNASGLTKLQFLKSIWDVAIRATSGSIKDTTPQETT
jgi:hypothetical protein